MCKTRGSYDLNMLKFSTQAPLHTQCISPLRCILTAELQHIFETAVCALYNVYIAARCLPWRQNSIQNKDKLLLYKNSHHRSEQFSCTHCVEKNVLMFITEQVYIFPQNSVSVLLKKTNCGFLAKTMML